MITNLFALAYLPPFHQDDERRDLIAALRDIPGIVASDKAINGEPAVPLSRLEAPETRDKLYAVWAMILDRASSGA